MRFDSIDISFEPLRVSLSRNAICNRTIETEQKTYISRGTIKNVSSICGVYFLSSPYFSPYISSRAAAEDRLPNMCAFGKSDRHFPYGSIVPWITQDPSYARVPRRSCTFQSRRLRSCIPPDFGFLAAPFARGGRHNAGLERAAARPWNRFTSIFTERGLPPVPVRMIIPDFRATRAVSCAACHGRYQRRFENSRQPESRASI